MSSVTTKKKVTIIGVGYVGSSIAYALVMCNIVDEIVLINRHIEKAQSEIDDIRHGYQFASRTKLRIGDYEDCRDSDVIVLAIGRNRKPGENRLDLANDNLKIVHSNIDNVKKNYNNAVIVVVTNPIDIITYKVSEWMNVPYGKIFGTGCILDTSRFIRVLADYFNVDITDIRAMVIGEHGDGQVLVWGLVKICGERIEDYCKNKGIVWNNRIKNEIENKVKNMGMSIIAHKGRTQYGISTCTADIVNAVVNDKKIKIPISSPMQGEYGITDVSLSYPSVVGKNGIESRLQIILNEFEKEKLKCCSEKLKKILK